MEIYVLEFFKLHRYIHYNGNTVYNVVITLASFILISSPNHCTLKCTQVQHYVTN